MQVIWDRAGHTTAAAAERVTAALTPLRRAAGVEDLETAAAGVRALRGMLSRIEAVG